MVVSSDVVLDDACAVPPLLPVLHAASAAPPIASAAPPSNVRRLTLEPSLSRTRASSFFSSWISSDISFTPPKICCSGCGANGDGAARHTPRGKAQTPCGPLLEEACDARDRQSQNDVNHHGGRVELEGPERQRHGDLALPHELVNADDSDQRRVLDDAHEVVGHGRDDDSPRLRPDHLRERACPAESSRKGSLPLSLVDRLQAGPIYLGEPRAVLQGEANHAGPERLDVETRDQGYPVIHPQDEHEGWDGAKDRDVQRRQRAHRPDG